MALPDNSPNGPAPASVRPDSPPDRAAPNPVPRTRFLPKLTWLTASIAAFITVVAAGAGFIVAYRYLPSALTDRQLLVPEPVEAAWRDSIERLGIEPLYPPDEDVYVGDIFVVIGDPASKPGSHDRNNAGSAAKRDTLLRSAVKISHLSVEKEIESEYAALPVFPNTATLIDKDKPQPQDDATGGTADENKSVFEPPPKHKRLPITAFPGLTILYSREGTLALGAEGQRTSLSGSLDQAEVVRIPVAETYGIRASVAWHMLDQFCRENSAVCNDDDFARNILLHTFGTPVCDTTEEKTSDNTRIRYKYPIEILFINRVYLARSIEQERSFQSVAGIGARLALQLRSALDNVNGQIAAQSSQSGAPASDTGKAARQALEAEKTHLEQMLQEVTGASAGASVALANANSSRFALNQTFVRPLVFGYRSVKFTLDPISDDAKEGCVP